MNKFEKCLNYSIKIDLKFKNNLCQSQRHLTIKSFIKILYLFNYRIHGHERNQDQKFSYHFDAKTRSSLIK